MDLRLLCWYFLWIVTVNNLLRHGRIHWGLKAKIKTAALGPSSVEIQRDWSDHALWWEQKQMWLLRTAWTLEKYGIHADAKLVFMPQHKPLRICLPSGITLRLRACFSNPVLQTVMGICRMLSESQLFSLCKIWHQFYSQLVIAPTIQCLLYSE